MMHAFWNSIGFSFLSSTIIFLMAIHFGATNIQLGYISSVFHMAGLIALLVPSLFRGANLIKVFYYSWLARGSVCFLYGLVFFLQGQAAVIFILVIYTLFAVLRIAGVTVSQPIQKTLFRDADTGLSIVRLNIRRSIAQLISQLASFGLLSIPFFSSIFGLVLITFFGAASNTVAARYMKNVPSRETVEVRKGRHLFKVFVDAMRHREIALTQLTRWFGLSAVIILALTVPFLRKEVGLAPNMVFLYAVTGSAAAVLAGFLLRPFVDNIGGKPLLTMANLLLAGTAVLWALSGSHLPPVLYFVYGFFTYFFLQVRLMLSSKLMIQVVPERDRVSYTAVTNFASAALAFVVGMTGGVLLNAGESIVLLGELPFFHSFSLAFLLSAVLAVLSLLFCLMLKDPGSLTVREAAEIFFSTKNLRAFLDVYQLDSTDDPIKREVTLLSLEQSDTHIATSELRKQLRTPLSGEKERILRSLFAYPRRELLDDLLAEAEDVHSYNRRDAIFTLGAYPTRKVRSTLAGFLRDADSEVVSTTLKSLARIGAGKYLPEARALLADESATPRAKLDCIIAITRMQDNHRYLRDVFHMAHLNRSPRFQQLVYIICARRLGLQPPIAGYFQSENLERGQGFVELIEEARQLEPFNTSSDRLIDHYNERRHAALWAWCTDRVSAVSADSFRSDLSHAILHHDPQAEGETGVLAAVYFTYHILLR